MKLILVKNLDNTFSIAYNSDYEKAKKLKAGEQFECEVKKKRNYKFHKKYFALINLVYDNQDVYNNIDHLRHDLTKVSGFYTIRKDMQGNEVIEVDSINFSSMDEFTFNELYSKTLDSIEKYFNFDKQEIAEHIEQYF